LQQFDRFQSFTLIQSKKCSKHGQVAEAHYRILRKAPFHIIGERLSAGRTSGDGQRQRRASLHIAVIRKRERSHRPLSGLRPVSEEGLPQGCSRFPAGPQHTHPGGLAVASAGCLLDQRCRGDRRSGLRDAGLHGIARFPGYSEVVINTLMFVNGNATMGKRRAPPNAYPVAR
jgi:hypothetical protein